MKTTTCFDPSNLKLAIMILLAAFGLPSVSRAAMAPDITDAITFGYAASESAHHFSDARSEKTSGGLGESAR